MELFSPASLWRRLAAWVIDALIVAACAGVIAGVTIGHADIDDSLMAHLISVLLGVMWMTYNTLTLSRPGLRNGKTLGKQLLRIHVVRADGEPLSITDAATRQLVQWGPLIVFGQFEFLTYVAFAWLVVMTGAALIGPGHLTLYDRLLNQKALGD